MDGGVRLHCCGGHHYRDHGDAQTPAGTHFFLPSLSARGERGGEGEEGEGDGIGVYGTGENDGAVVLFLPSPHYPVGKDAKLLADRIARGANVTVILPMVGALEGSLPDVTPETGRKEKRKRSAPVTVEAYIEGVTRLGVSSIGLLATTPDALPADTTGLACVVLLSTTTAAAVSSSSSSSSSSSCSQESMEKIGVPVSVITLSAVASEKTKGQQDGDGNIRRTEITTDHGVGLLNDESAQGYTETMREVLYFFKKHLHDWS